MKEKDMSNEKAFTGINALLTNAASIQEQDFIPPPEHVGQGEEVVIVSLPHNLRQLYTYLIQLKEESGTQLVRVATRGSNAEKLTAVGRSALTDARAELVEAMLAHELNMLAPHRKLKHLSLDLRKGWQVVAVPFPAELGSVLNTLSTCCEEHRSKTADIRTHVAAAMEMEL